LNIAGTEYNLNHKSLEIYLSGCKSPHCKGCHNTALWDFEIGDPVFGNSSKALYDKCKEDMVEKVWVMGGEPLDQKPDELEIFLNHLFWYMGKPIWLWTRYLEIPDTYTKYLAYAKIGEYREDLPGYTEPEFGITLASNNQRIIKCG
jgi:organic radical activating enzyme